MSPRIANVLLGVWLFISAFLWSHSPAEFTNTWIVGVLCVLFAVIAMRYDQARYLNTALAVWLFVSAWALPHFSIATVWNNAIEAIAIFFVSLIPSGEYVPRRSTTGGPPSAPLP